IKEPDPPKADRPKADRPKADRPKLTALEEALVEKLKDKDWRVRKEVCDGLAGLKSTAAAAWVADFVAGEAYDREPGTARESSRDAAVLFLKEVAPDQVEAALPRALQPSKPEVRAWAGRAVAGLKKK